MARTDWDRNRARPAVGGGFPFPALSIAGRVHIPTMADVSRRPPIIPDGRISRVRFETLAFLPWAFPRLRGVYTLGCIRPRQPGLPTPSPRLNCHRDTPVLATRPT